MNISRLEAELSAKASRDAAFRDALRRDAQTALTQFGGVSSETANSVRVEVVDQAGGKVAVKLITLESEELSEAQLAAVVGGVMHLKNGTNPFGTPLE